MKLITLFKNFIKVIESYRWQVNANKQIENCLNQRKTKAESAIMMIDELEGRR